MPGWGHAQRYSTVGASGRLSVAQQLYNRFDTAGKPLKGGEIAIVDAAPYSDTHSNLYLERAKGSRQPCEDLHSSDVYKTCSNYPDKPRFT